MGGREGRDVLYGRMGGDGGVMWEVGWCPICWHNFRIIGAAQN